jgi:hypothetical protein
MSSYCPRLYYKNVKSEISFNQFWRWCITQNYWVFWTFSIVWYSRQHDVSKTGSVSVLRWRWGRRHLQWLRLALSKGLNWVGLPWPIHLRMETDPVSETSCSLEYQTMEKVQKPTNSVWDVVLGKTLSLALATIDRFGLDDWIYWYVIHSHKSGLQVIQRYRRLTHFTAHRCIRTRILSLHKPYPGNGFITISLSFQITHEVFLAQPNSFLAISSQSSSTAISRTRTNSIYVRSSLYSLARTPRKTPFSIINDACLLVRYLAIKVLLLCACVLHECTY